MKKFYFITLCLLCTNATQSASKDKLRENNPYVVAIQNTAKKEHKLDICYDVIKIIFQFIPVPNKGNYQFAKVYLPVRQSSTEFFINQEGHKKQTFYDDQLGIRYCMTNLKEEFYLGESHKKKFTLTAPDLVPNVDYADKLEDEIDQDRERNPEAILEFIMTKAPYYYDGKQVKQGTLKVPKCVKKKIFNAIHRCKEACPSSLDSNDELFTNRVSNKNKDRIIMKLHKENERVISIGDNKLDNYFEVFVQAKPSELENQEIGSAHPINDLFSNDVSSVVLESYEESLYSQLLEQEKLIAKKEQSRLQLLEEQDKVDSVSFLLLSLLVHLNPEFKKFIKFIVSIKKRAV